MRLVALLALSVLMVSISVNGHTNHGGKGRGSHAMAGKDIKTCHFWPPIHPDWFKYVSKTCTGPTGSKVADKITDDRGSCKTWKINGEDYQRCSSCGQDDFLIGLGLTSVGHEVIGVCMRVSMNPESGEKFPWNKEIKTLASVKFMEFGHSETTTAKFISQVVITDNDRTVVNPLITGPPTPTKAPTPFTPGGKGGVPAAEIPPKPRNQGGFLSTQGSFTLSGGPAGAGNEEEDEQVELGEAGELAKPAPESSSFRMMNQVSSNQAAKIQEKVVINSAGETVRQVLQVTTEVNEAEQSVRPYLLQIQSQQGFAYGNMKLKNNKWEEHVSAYFVQGTKWTSCVPVLDKQTKKAHSSALKKCQVFKNTYQCYQKDCPYNDKPCETLYMDPSRALIHNLKSLCGEMHEVIINSM